MDSYSSPQGLTALMMAARGNRFQALALLLTAKPKPADPNRVDDEQQVLFSRRALDVSLLLPLHSD